MVINKRRDKRVSSKLNLMPKYPQKEQVKVTTHALQHLSFECYTMLKHVKQSQNYINTLRLRVMRLILNIIFGGVMTVLAY